MSRQILVLGATGASGLLFCQKAIERGHKLIILARSPHKLPDQLREHPDVTIIKGDYGNRSKVDEALNTSASTLVSFAGPTANSQGTPVTDLYRQILPILATKGFERAMILGTPAWISPEDKSSFKWKLAIKSLQLFANAGYREMHGIGSVVSSQPSDKVKWTLFRVPFLGGEQEAPVQATFVGCGKDGLSLSRGSMVKWVLDEMDDCNWVGKAPVLFN